MHRAIRWLLLSLLVLAVPASQAQNSWLIGAWQGAANVNGQRYLIAVVFQPGGQFSEQIRSGPLMTLTTGSYQWLSRNVIHMTVEDWEPKSQCFPQSGCHRIRKPPGSRVQIAFSGPNAMRTDDLDFGGTVYYRRTR